MMKLYGDPGSGSTRRVAAVLYHVGTEFELELVDLFKGENRTPQFLLLNPNGMIPVLVDGDVVLYEASAINLYLVDKFNSDLLPKGHDRALTFQWMFWAAEHWRQGPPVLFTEHIAKKAMGLPQDPRAIEEANASIRKYAAVLDAHLEGRRFVVGERVTLADFDLAATFTHLKRTFPPYEEFPNVMAWHNRMLSDVPAWARTYAEVEDRMVGLMKILEVAK
jgi:glutathione S-transferase